MKTTEEYSYAIDTAMLQSYHTSDHKTQLKEVISCLNENGQIDVFIINSENLVCLIRPDYEIEPGWELLESNINAQLIAISPKFNSSGQRLFAARAALDGSSRMEIMELIVVSNNLVVSNSHFIDREYNVKTQLKCGLMEVDGKLECFTLISGGLDKSSVMLNMKSGEWFFTHYDFQTASSILDCYLSPFSPDDSCGTWPYLQLACGVTGWVNYKPFGSFVKKLNATAVDPNNKQVIFNSSNIFYKEECNGELLEPCVEDYCSVKEKDNQIAYFVVVKNEESIPSYKTLCRKYDGGQWGTTEPIGGKLASDLNHIDKIDLNSIIAVCNLRGQIELTILDDTRNVLMHCYEVSPGMWTSWLPISKNCNAYGCAIFENKFSQIIEHTWGSQLNMLYQTETENQTNDYVHDWNSNPIHWLSDKDTEDEIELTEGQAYRTCISAFDSNKAVADGVKCLIQVNDFLPCFVNGHYIEMQADVSYDFETNELGQINIEYVLESSIYSPSFTVSPNDGLFLMECKPDRDTVAFLSSVTANDFEWKNENGTGIIPADKNTEKTREDTALAICNAAKMIQSYYEPEIDPDFPLCNNVKTMGLNIWKKKSFKNKKVYFPSPNTEDTFFRFSLINGQTDFSLMNQTDFLQYRKQHVDGREKYPKNFEGVFDFFGDLFEAAKDIGGAVVDIIWNGTKAGVSFIIDGISYFVDIVLTHARDFLDIVCSILDILGTIIGTILVWILDMLGFLFDWKKIIEKKNEIKNNVLEGFKSFKGEMDEKYNQFESIISDWINKIPNIVDTDQGIISQDPVAKEESKIYETNLRDNMFNVGGNNFWDSGTWLINTIINKVSTQIIPGFDARELLENFSNSLDRIEALFKDTIPNEFLAMKEKAQQVFKDFIENPLNIVSLTFNALVDILKQMLNCILTIFKMILTAGVEMLRAFTNIVQGLFSWLDKKIYIPFVSSFYKTVIKSELTLLDFLCLIIAIPVSIIESLLGSLNELQKDGKALAASICIFISEIFGIVEAKFDVKGKEVPFFGLLSDILSIVAGILVLNEDVNHINRYTGVIIIIISFLELGIKVRKIFLGNVEDDPLLIKSYDLFAGLVNTIAGIIGVAEDHEKKEGTYYQGIGNITWGIRYFVSGTLNLIDENLKKSKPYMVYIGVSTTIISGTYLKSSGYLGDTQQIKH